MMGSPSQLPPIPSQWRSIVTTLVQMLQRKQCQLEFLFEERKFLKDRINLQNHLWSQDVSSFRDQIMDFDKKYKQLKLDRLLQSSKSDLVLGMKKKETLLCKIKLEYVEADLEDMRSYAEIQSKQANNGQSDASLELRKLKRDYEKLVCRNNSEVLALLSERDFVWNQLKRMEDEYISLIKIKSKHLESAQVNVGKLQTEVERLHAAANDKDIALANLKAGIQQRDREVERLSHELAQLLKELQCMRAIRSTSAASLDDHNLITQEDEMSRLEKSSSKQPASVQDSNRKDEDEQSVRELLRKLKEISKEMEIKNIENENLRMLCSDLEYQLKKLKHQTKGGCGPKEDVSRNLIEELKTASMKESDRDSLSKHQTKGGCCPKEDVSRTASMKESDRDSLSKTYYQQKETPNEHELLNVDPSVGSETPLKKEKRNDALKGSHSSRRKRAKVDSKSGVPILFASAFKVPKLKVSHSALK